MENKVFISTVLSVNYFKNGALSNFISRLYRCTAKYVDISKQNLTFNELKFLIGHGDVIEIKLSSVKDQNGNPFKFEDIIPFIPKIQKLHIVDIVYSSVISQFLLDFSFKNKIERFEFGDAEILPDPAEFVEFILKNSSPFYSSHFTLYYRDGNALFDYSDDFGNDDDGFYIYDDDSEATTFRKTVRKVISEKWKGPKRPYFSTSCRVY
uniref:FTH domain-containing protein n=1 Tax=Panagrolaimus sp. ES5 TaxID=591445 RepID=A0AC34GA89_9BILA